MEEFYQDKQLIRSNIMHYTTALVNVVSSCGLLITKAITVKNTGVELLDRLEEDYFTNREDWHNININDEVQFSINGNKTNWYKITNTGFVKVI